MKPLGLLYLYRVRLRSRLVQEVLAMIGIAVGVGLLFASQIANTSLTGSVRQLSGGLVGQSRLQLVARDPRGFEQTLLASVRRLPDVRSAAPIIEAQASVSARGGRRSVDLIGADPRFVHLGGSLLRHFSAAALARQRALALPQPIADQIVAGALQPLELQIGASTHSVLLGVTLHEADIGALVHSPVALAPLRYAQRLTGMSGRLTRIFVAPLPGRTAQVRSELVALAGGRVNVESTDYDARLFGTAAGPTNQSTAIFAAISALVGFLFAFNAILLTVPARRRLIAELRLDGYGPLTIIQVLLLDALVLGAISCLLGLTLGDELSVRLFRASPGYLSFAFPVGSQRIVTTQSVVIAVAGGVLAACVGVLAPLRDALLTPRGIGLRVASSARARARLSCLGGFACLATTTIILLLAPGAAVVGVVALTAAMLLLLPGIIRGLLAVTARLTLDVRATAPSVALSELRSTWTRTVAIAATGALAVFGSVAIQGAHADLQRGLDRSAADVSRAAPVWAFPPGLSNLLATTPFHVARLRELATLPGVQAVRIYRGGFLDYRARRVWVSAPPRTQLHMVPSHQLVQGRLDVADARLRERGWAVVSKTIASAFHLRIGQFFTLPATHPTRFRVAALSTNVGWPPGAVIINAEDFARAWETRDASAYELIPAAGVSARAVRDETQRALGPSSGLDVLTARERELRQRAASRQGLSRLSEISTLVLIAAILAMAAAMGNMIWQRRPRLASLKLDGFSDLAVWRALLFESLLLVGASCATGALFGLYGQLLGSHAILSVTGFPVVFSFGVLGALSSFALVTVVAVAITAIPGFLIARVRPAANLTEWAIT